MKIGGRNRMLEGGATFVATTTKAFPSHKSIMSAAKTVESVQTFGRKVRICTVFSGDGDSSIYWFILIKFLTLVSSLLQLIFQKTSTAVAFVKKGNGLIKVNGSPISLLQPEILRLKTYEPLLLLGADKFANVRNLNNLPCLFAVLFLSMLFIVVNNRLISV
ncbi:30S ribosomal protein S9 [archaeon]|nr:MAG: 30S ribosomal protein S9 [archaeon]